MKKLMTVLLTILMTFSCMLVVSASRGDTVYVKDKCNFEYGLDSGCYTSFQEAYDNTSGSSESLDNLVLYTNITLEDSFTVASDKTFDLDLHYHFITAKNGFNVESENFVISGNGYIYTSDTEDKLSQYAKDGYTITFDNGTYDVTEIDWRGVTGGNEEGWPEEYASGEIDDSDYYYYRYTSIQDAINNNLDKYLTITLHKDVEEDIVVPSNGYVNIDINGHVIKGSITNNGHVRLGDGYSQTPNGVYDVTITDNSGDLKVYGNYSYYTQDVTQYLYSKYYKVTQTGDLYHVEYSDYQESEATTTDTIEINEVGDPNFDSTNVTSIELYSSEFDSSYLEEAEEKAIVEKANSIGNNASVAQYFDIGLVAFNSSGDHTYVTSTKNEIEVTINLNDETYNAVAGKDVKVIRYHDDSADILDTTFDETNKTIKFKSNLFSIYAIVASDKKSSDGTNNSSSNTSVTTRTEANTPCEEWNHSKNWTWSESQGKCVYRVSNTSAK